MKPPLKLRTLLFVGGVLLIMCILILFAPSIWVVDKLDGKSNDFLLFLGIGQLILLTGIILFAFYYARLWHLCYALSETQEEKKAEFEEKLKLQGKLNEDAQKRRLFEQERNRINDLFRLIELAKEKPEEISDRSVKKMEGGDSSTTETNILTKKNEVVNTEKLTKFINEYNSLTSKQPNT